VAVESRGFLFGAPLAYDLKKRLVIIRKKGKLSRKTRDVVYTCEYGSDILSVHEDSLSKENRVVIVDDLLATGGTTHAVCDLVQSTGAEILILLVLIELKFLNGVEKLLPHEVASVVVEV